jgi:hypothetical protein
MEQARNMRVRTQLITGLLALLVALGAAAITPAAARAAARPQLSSATGAIPRAGHIGAATGKHRLAGAQAPGRHAGGTPYGSFDTFNWDGYVATNTSSFNAVSATYTVPTAHCDSAQPEDEWAAFWVGLDGFGSGTVEQDGVSAFCNGNGQAFYSAWWDMAPAFPTTVFNVKPGDTIRASVTYDTSAGEFDFLIDDVTSGQSLSAASACETGQGSCARSSAEVISEDAFGGDDIDGLYFLPAYNSVAYSNVSVTDSSGHTGSLTDPAWTANSVRQVSSQGVTKQTASALSSDGASFGTTWQHELGSPVPLLYQVLNSSYTTTQIQFAATALNQASSAVPLSDVTIRYWFTQDSSVPMVFSCDYAVVGCSNVTATFGTIDPSDPSRTYLQIGFTSRAGTVGAGDWTGIVQVRAHRSDWGSIPQINTISFNASDTSLKFNPGITVYDNGTLVYGIQP